MRIAGNQDPIAAAKYGAVHFRARPTRPADEESRELVDPNTVDTVSDGNPREVHGPIVVLRIRPRRPDGLVTLFSRRSDGHPGV